jgi:hypothetical protein
MPKAKEYSLTKGKAAVLLAYEKKLIKFFKPYGMTKVNIDKVIHKDFLSPVIKTDSRLKYNLKDFKAFAKQVYDSATETEEEAEKYDDQYD